jgi:hypothetical protein
MARGEIAGQAAKHLVGSPALKHAEHAESHFIQKIKHNVAEKLTQAVREAEIPPIT